MVTGRTKLKGNVEKVIKSVTAREPDKAQIEIEQADRLYKEIRIDNVVTDENGHQGQLEPGEQVEVTIEAHSEKQRKDLHSHGDGQKKDEGE